jgi:adenine-specific DNA-methyltransferase
VEVRSLDHCNTKTGNVESGGEDKIAIWSLDTDYDWRILHPRLVFFPMSGPNCGWDRVARDLKWR